METTEITPAAFTAGSAIIASVMPSSPERMVKSGPQHARVRRMFWMSAVASLTVFTFG